MKTKNAMQLKAMIKKVAIEKNVSPQLALQNYMLERILARIEKSSYRENFIVKGGFLIGSMIGLDSRTTMDLDTTVKDFPLTKERLIEIFNEICMIDANDDMTFRIDYVTEIRENDEYPGLRIAFKSDYEKMSIPLTIDFTTGDIITPAAIESEIETMFNEGVLRVYSYNLETILSEKIETILSRVEANSRPRDFYDIFILLKLRGELIDYRLLKLAIERTSAKRGSSFILESIDPIVRKIKQSDSLRNNWQRYRKSNAYAEDISYDQVCDALEEILKQLNSQ